MTGEIDPIEPGEALTMSLQSRGAGLAFIAVAILTVHVMYVSPVAAAVSLAGATAATITCGVFVVIDAQQ